MRIWEGRKFFTSQVTTEGSGLSISRWWMGLDFDNDNDCKGSTRGTRGRRLCDDVPSGMVPAPVADVRAPSRGVGSGLNSLTML